MKWIRRTIVSALYEARAAKRSIDTGMIEAEIGRMRPLSVTMAERVAYLRAWATDRTARAE